MPGLDIDTSSYPKLPTTSPNFLDFAGKLQGLQQGSQAIQSNAITLQQQQLGLIQSRFKAISGQIPGLLSKPDLNENDIRQFYQNNVKEGLMDSDTAATEIGQIPPTQGITDPKIAALTLKNYMGNKLQMAQSTMEALNYHLGEKGQNTDNSQIINTLSSPKPGFAGNPQTGGTIQSGPGIPIQPGPTQPTVSQGAPGQPPRGTPGIMGPSAPPTGLSTSPGAGHGSILPFSPGTPPPQIVGTGGVPTAGAPTPVKTQSFTATGLPPGANQAMTASGEQLAQDRLHAANFQRDIFPLVKAIPALETLGTKGTGPGTETINQVKSFILSNVPVVTEKDMSNIKNFDEAKKYLTDFVNQTGNSGTNDKLAAAFAGNPSVGISNAAAVDVAKSALALRRMKQAQLLTFENSGLPESEYSRWNAQQINQLDPRAFGVDMMKPAAKKALLDQLNKNPDEKANFEKSVGIAQKLKFIAPPSSSNQ